MFLEEVLAAGNSQQARSGYAEFRAYGSGLGV